MSGEGTPVEGTPEYRGGMAESSCGAVEKSGSRRAGDLREGKFATAEGDPAQKHTNGFLLLLAFFFTVRVSGKRG